MISNYDKLINFFKSTDFRLTPQRIAISKILAKSTDHPTSQQIYALLKPDFPSLSLATVYNTLETLVNAGIINALGNAGDDTIHYDAETEPHINLACIQCNRVVDFPSSYIADVENEVQYNSGYQVLGARVLYYGLCPECQKEP